MIPLLSSWWGLTGRGFFPLYVEVLEELAPLFFAFDHVSYASIHKCLSTSGTWILCLRPSKRSLKNIQTVFLLSTHNKFSTIRPSSWTGGQDCKRFWWNTHGLTENPNAFRRWVISWPEKGWLQKEFENCKEDPKTFQHHEQSLSMQKTFQRHVASLSANY